MRLPHTLEGVRVRGARARKRALGRAHDLAEFHPFLRPRQPEVIELLEDLMARLPESGSDRDHAQLEPVVDAVADQERRRLVESYATRDPHQWRRICAEAGDPADAERWLVLGTLCAATRALRPLQTPVLEAIEADGEGGPVHALAQTIWAGDVWSLDDASAAVGAAHNVNPQSVAWRRSIEAVAAERLTAAHVARLRQLAARVATRLPAAGFPRASAVLATACERARRDRDFVAEVASFLLAAYVLALELDPRFSFSLVTANRR